ncbi:MAG: LacI family transcriptional regulator [Caldilineaceae bacterium]|nr:LacI family transcriptional regulator [Caldilineaceae bacterium]
MRARVTISDVARAANVSTQTVSRAINNKREIRPETRRHVLTVVERLGYEPNSLARGLATDRTAALGIIVPDIANPFFVEIIRGAEDLALEHDYNIFLCNTVENPAREAAMLKLLEQKRVDGIVLCSSCLTDDELQPLLARQRAVTLVNRPLLSAAEGAVWSDAEAGMRMSVEHLLHSGRRRIAFLGHLENTYGRRARRSGYESTLREHGIAVDSSLIGSCMPYMKDGLATAHNLLQEHREIDALICHNDLVAVGALQACHNLGVGVPDDIAIIGCDDIALAALVCPALTTLRVPSHELGRCAVSMIFDALVGVEHQAERVYTPELIVRQSAP